MKFKIVLVIIFSFLILIPVVQAEDFFYLKSLSYPLGDDYTLTSPDGEVSITAFARSPQDKLLIKLMSFVPQKRIYRYFTYPDNLKPASDLYFLKFSPYSELNFSTPPKIKIKYKADNYFKNIYYYDWSELKFKKLAVERDSLNQTLTFDYLPTKKRMLFAVFNEPELVGAASWYVYPKYAGQLIAASRDFAKGQQLKVTNLYNDKEVVVTVQDYGPRLCANWTEKEQKLMGPCQERVLDLSKSAFLKLATSTAQGIISKVKIEPF